MPKKVLPMTQDQRHAKIQSIYDHCLDMAALWTTTVDDRLGWLRSASLCQKMLEDNPADTLHKTFENMKSIADLINNPLDDVTIDSLMEQAAEAAEAMKHIEE